MSLPAPHEVSHFVHLSKDADTDAFLPVYTIDMRSGNVTEVLGFMWFTRGRLYGFMYDADTADWEKIDILDRSDDAFMEIDHPFDTSVSVVGDDILPARELYYRLKDQLRTQYNVDVMSELMEEQFLDDGTVEYTSDITRLTQFPECSHEGTVTQSFDDQFDAPVRVCRDCDRVVATKVEGEWTSRTDGFDATWIAETCDPVQMHDEYTVFTSALGASVGRAEVPLLFMGADAEYECQTLTGYDPSIFEGAVFAVDGDVVGYLAWNETFDEASSIALRQVFVRDEYRGQQIADEMIASWWESRPETFLYVGDPNPAGRRVIGRLGLYDETVDGQVVAKDTYVMPSVGVPVQEPLV